MESKFCEEWKREYETGLADGDAQPLSRCAAYHFRVLGGEAFFSSFCGDPEKFFVFAENEWGWTVKNLGNEILIDEGKPNCVCPLVTEDRDGVTPALCECSALFCGKIFSVVYGRRVKAEVIRSVLRGEKTCVYRVILEEEKENESL